MGRWWEMAYRSAIVTKEVGVAVARATMAHLACRLDSVSGMPARRSWEMQWSNL